MSEVDPKICLILVFTSYKFWIRKWRHSFVANNFLPWGIENIFVSNSSAFDGIYSSLD